MKPVLVMGGAHIDRNGTMNAPYLQGSSIPGTMTEDVGGGAFNIASNLARLGIPVIFSSPRADDQLTFAIQSKLRTLSNFKDIPIEIEGNSPSYTAIKNTDGELIAALADMKLYDGLDSDSFLTRELQEEISRAEILITDANFPRAILNAVGELKDTNCQWFAVATSPAKVERLLPSLKRLHLLSMNVNEACKLTGLTSGAPSELIDELKRLGLKNGIITIGPEGMIYFADNAESINLKAYSTNKVLDVTGAGDATLAGYIAAILRGEHSKNALKAGLAAAKITIEANGACSEQLSMKSIEDILAAH